MKTHYIDDVLDGLFETYFDNGQIKVKITYKNGLENGTLIQFTKDGQLTSFGEMVNGELLDNSEELEDLDWDPDKNSDFDDDIIKDHFG